MKWRIWIDRPTMDHPDATFDLDEGENLEHEIGCYVLDYLDEMSSRDTAVQVFASDGSLDLEYTIEVDYKPQLTFHQED